MTWLGAWITTGVGAEGSGVGAGAEGSGVGAGGGITDFIGTGSDFFLIKLRANSIIGIEATMYFQDFITHGFFR